MTSAAERPPVSAWIDRFRHLVPPGGAVLDVAAGRGRHSELFLVHGHPVTAVDRDTAALAALAGREGLEILAVDLETDAPWPFPAGSFAGVVVCNYLHRPRLSAIVDTVAAGGVLLYETFAAGNERFGRPRNPDFLLRPGELLAAVGDRLNVVAYEHGITGGAQPRVRQRICAVAAPGPAPLVAAP